MRTDDLAFRFRKLILDPAVDWEEIDGPADHPEARAFAGTMGHWRFLVIGAPPDDGGRIAIGGTALNLMTGEAFVLPLELAKLAYDRASSSR